MHFGLFCFYEDHHGDYARALADQAALVQHAEHLGFEEAWVAEHHFNDFGISPSILLLMTHLAGITSRIRLGSAALLLPFHDPIRIAEDLATLDHLCGGRLNLGIAHGGPFPAQNRHFKVPAENARARTYEALEVVAALLNGGSVSHVGAHFQLDGVEIQPKPLQGHIPLWLATQSSEGVAYAARNGYGLMGGQTAEISRLAVNLQHYREVNANAQPSLVVLRSFFVAKTREAALASALPAIQRFRERMRPQFNDLTPFAATANSQNLFLEQGVIGDVAECREKIRQLRDELDPASLVLKPVALDVETARNSLSLFNKEVRPYV